MSPYLLVLSNLALTVHTHTLNCVFTMVVVSTHFTLYLDATTGIYEAAAGLSSINFWEASSILLLARPPDINV